MVGARRPLALLLNLPIGTGPSTSEALTFPDRDGDQR
jgi:hypothetical protein